MACQLWLVFVTCGQKPSCFVFTVYVFWSYSGSWPAQSTNTSRGTDGVSAGGRNEPSGCMPHEDGSGSAGSPGTRWKSSGRYFLAPGAYGEPAMVLDS